ncbi:hypothetical protein BDV39DRAFT_204742 [Aspergillus sergii]|uniref:Uncharacterized protein n=1 Tax=Aspergillus sergii TaxID=1034303 RepID=A0A5N6X606_9EURO|nr:hypothetical protein BDV39DRAFT_204742 [Aspergillus sergii]
MFHGCPLRYNCDAPLDSGYDPSLFPCSQGKPMPCRGTEVVAWTSASNPKLPSGKSFAPYSFNVDHAERTMLTVTDSAANAERYRILIDGKYLGETSGVDFEGKSYNGGAEEALQSGHFSRGYFIIPPGNITVEWPEHWGNWGVGLSYGGSSINYRIDKLCDPYTCNKGPDGTSDDESNGSGLASSNPCEPYYNGQEVKLGHFTWKVTHNIKSDEPFTDAGVLDNVSIEECAKSTSGKTIKSFNYHAPTRKCELRYWEGANSQPSEDWCRFTWV